MKTAFINCRLLDGTKDMKLQEGVKPFTGKLLL